MQRQFVTYMITLAVMSVAISNCLAQEVSSRDGQLLEAAKNGNVGAVAALLKAGAAIGAKDTTGRTPLHLAASGGHQATARTLLDSGADINAEDNDGHTPLDAAVANGHTGMAKFLHSRNGSAGKTATEGSPGNKPEAPASPAAAASTAEALAASPANSNAPGVSLFAKPEQFKGTVVLVRSGDTLFCQQTDKTGAPPAWVRLHGVACPLATQPYGKAAKSFTERLALRQTVDICIVGMDGSGGPVAEVTLPDGRDLAVVLLNAGLAWCNPNSQKAKSYAALETAARAAKMGLWADAKPAPPWSVAAEELKTPAGHERAMNCVVVVRTTDGLGSGFFVTSTGMIITNHHVVGTHTSVEITTRASRKLAGKVLQTDIRRDLALIQVTAANFPHLSIGSVTDADIGADVIAIGSPMGLQWSLSKGIVSALRKDEGVLYIQTDTAINDGNSGGPLIAVKTGKVIGINTLVLVKRNARGDVFDTQGLNFALAASEIRAAFPSLRTD